MDTRTPEQRRRIMQSVGHKNTKPETVVRKAAHALGYRFRLYRKDLPGTPDLVFPGRKKVLFVHGCFWHGHDCPKGRLPKSNPEFWGAKIEGNKRRDAVKAAALTDLGWQVGIVWQCQVKDHPRLDDTLRDFLGQPRKSDRHFGDSPLGSPSDNPA